MLGYVVVICLFVCLFYGLIICFLQCLPQCNAVWSGNDVQLLPTVDISVAVATESGLITPIIKETNKLSMENISTTVKVSILILQNYSVKSYYTQVYTIAKNLWGRLWITDILLQKDSRKKDS